MATTSYVLTKRLSKRFTHYPKKGIKLRGFVFLINWKQRNWPILYQLVNKPLSPHNGQASMFFFIPKWRHSLIQIWDKKIPLKRRHKSTLIRSGWAGNSDKHLTQFVEHIYILGTIGTVCRLCFLFYEFLCSITCS